MVDVNLTVEDLNSVITLIDAVTQRGAIRGEELLAVGQIRVKYEQAAQSLAKSVPAKTETPEAEPQK